MTMDCSIIISTRNRATALEKTLRAFREVHVPGAWQVEMLVVDNGSSDRTAEVVRQASHASFPIHYVDEPRPGKCRALNTALALAKGQALLFTDDDVEPAANWVEAMARPLLEKHCDAVAGRILLAENLRRPWFTHMHCIWLAEARELDSTPCLVGASMGIHRNVFDQLDNFDEELGPGPGALGAGEETLVWMQMLEAGMRISPVTDTYIIHHPDPLRLLRSSWLVAAKSFGRSNAYVMHHWEHGQVAWPALSALWVRGKLALRRLTRWPVGSDPEGCPDWELSYLTQIEGLRHFREESRRPRHYHLRALRRRPPPCAACLLDDDWS